MSNSCNPMDSRPPGSSVHEISQARILEWVTMSLSRGSSPPRDQTCVSCVSYVGRWILYNWTMWEPLITIVTPNNTWHCSNFSFFPWNEFFLPVTLYCHVFNFWKELLLLKFGSCIYWPQNILSGPSMYQTLCKALRKFYRNIKPQLKTLRIF